MELDQVLPGRGGSFNCPRLLRLNDLAHLDIERLHHLAGVTIGHDDNRIAITVGEFEGKEPYDWNVHVRYEIAQSGKWLLRYAIGHGFGDGLFGLPESSGHERYDHSESDLRDAIWVTQAGYIQ